MFDSSQCSQPGEDAGGPGDDQVDWSEVLRSRLRLFDEENALAGDASRIEESDAVGTLDLARGTARFERLAQARVLRLAAHWADLHGRPELPARGRHHGQERLMTFGGVGTPEVAEFAPAELGAALGITTDAAAAMIADALDLRHRLPLLWERVQSGDVRPWLARRVAERSRPLSSAGAAYVDKRIARLADTVPWGRLRRIIDAAVLAADPERAAAETERAEGERGVWLSPDDDHGLGTMTAKTRAVDLRAFEASVSLVAEALGVLGDLEPVQGRRATALGVLASPSDALRIIEGADRARQAAASECSEAGRPDSPPRRLTWGKATLYVHVNHDDVQRLESAGITRAEEIGPLLLDQVSGWLRHRNVKLVPVLDPKRVAPVDSYEVPHRMSEALRCTGPADCFPHASSVSRRMDLDHTSPYVADADVGPPAQTRLDNLGPMTRSHHRVKTHGRWRVSQPRDGTFLWRSPSGFWYLVDDRGTIDLGRPAD